MPTNPSVHPAVPQRLLILIGLGALARLTHEVRQIAGEPLGGWSWLLNRFNFGLPVMVLAAILFVWQILPPIVSHWRTSLKILYSAYALWWPVMGYAVLAHRDFSPTPANLMRTALIFHSFSGDSRIPGTEIGSVIFFILSALLLISILDRTRYRWGFSWLVKQAPMPLAVVRRGYVWLLGSPAHAPKVRTLFLAGVPGLALTSLTSFDLIARQQVERITINSTTGVVLSLSGPVLTTFLWAIITASFLGIILTASTKIIWTRIHTNTWIRPPFFLTFASTVALGFAVRLTTLLLVAPTRTDGGDPLFYHTTANLLARGRGFPEPLNFVAYQKWIPSALHGPLYPIVLSISSRLGGSSYFDHKFLSILIGTGVVAMTGIVARLIAGAKYGNATGLIAAFLAAIYPNLWLVDSVLFPEGLMALGTLSTVYAAYRWRHTARYRWALAMGLLVGLTALTRGEGVLLSVLLVLPWILLNREISWSHRFKQLLIAAIACILVLAPWTIRNSRSFEVAVPLSTNGNELFVYANCAETYEGKFLGFWLFSCQEELRSQGREALGDEAQKSVYWRHIGLQYVADHARDLPKVVAARIGRQWELYRPWQNTEFAPIEGRNKTAARAGLVMYYALAGLSLYGALLLRRRGQRLLPLAALFANVTLTAAYAYGTTRFRVPAEPALCILGAVGLIPLAQSIRHRWSSSDAYIEIPRSENSMTNKPFVLGGLVSLRQIFARRATKTWLSLVAVCAAVATALPALYRATGSTMEEGFMLIFPERLIKGDIANVDFLHLYGPGSLHFLSMWYRLFGVSMTAERSFGLVQHMALIIGLIVLTRPWGRLASTLVGLISIIFIITPIGLQALAWSGGLSLGVWALIFILRARHSAPTQARTAWIIAGVLSAVTLTFRPDLILAVGLVALWGLWRLERRILLYFVMGMSVGLTSLWIHIIQAGAGKTIQGILLDPVFKLRGGRELPRPPSWDHLDGALQVISEKFAPWWGVPHISAPKQLFLWFFILPLVAFAILFVARRIQHPARRCVLTAAGLFGIGILPQALQRPDSAHFLWVSCISWPLLIIAIIEVVRQRLPTSHPRLRLGIGVGSLSLLILVVTPFYTIRPYIGLLKQSVGGDLGVLEVRRAERNFYLGDTRPWLATKEVITDLDAMSKPDQRLFVGPVDLRQTAYSDAFFYHLFPELTPATYFIEMDPGMANAVGSRLADDVASADWLILTRFWSGWIEPNDSVVFGPDEPNQVVENNFCLRGSYQHDVLRLYEKCHPDDTSEVRNIGPYNGPYEPEHDYAVEVLVPVPPRPDGTCTPTCNGQPSSTGVEINIDTALIADH